MTPAPASVRSVYVDGHHVAAAASIFSAAAVYAAVHVHWTAGAFVFACSAALHGVLLVAERVSAPSGPPPETPVALEAIRELTAL